MITDAQIQDAIDLAPKLAGGDQSAMLHWSSGTMPIGLARRLEALKLVEVSEQQVLMAAVKLTPNGEVMMLVLQAQDRLSSMTEVHRNLLACFQLVDGAAGQALSELGFFKADSRRTFGARQRTGLTYGRTELGRVGWDIVRAENKRRRSSED